MCSTMANWWRNALLLVNYPMVICTVFGSYLGAVLTDRIYLIPDIVNRITNTNGA
jgi:uncharacterized membrane protein